MLLGNLIKAAISRQREFLADASSVQFTRNPAGLAGALKKIGGLAEGSRIRDAHAHEISHMFFGDAFAGSFFNLFATHPPLEERIRLLDPSFDGSYSPTEAVSEEQGAASGEQAARLHALGSVLPTPRPLSTDRGRILAPGRHSAAGTPRACGPHGCQFAGRGAPGGARALCGPRCDLCALLLSREDPPTRQRQWQLLQQYAEPPLAKMVQQLSAPIDQLPPDHRLSVADLAIPALKRLSPAQYGAFRQIVEALTAADGKIDLFEYFLRVILFGCLDVQFGLRPAPAVRYKSIDAVAPAAIVILSALAYAGQSEPDAIQRAFQAGTVPIFAGTTRSVVANMGLSPSQILPRQKCMFADFDAALGQLAQAAPAVKRQVLDAVVACIAADGKMTIEENELLRAVASALSCPLPPVPVAE